MVGAEVVKAGVKSRAVVEGLDVVEDGGAGLGTGGEAVVIDQLVFEAAPERFDKGRYRNSSRNDLWKR